MSILNKSVIALALTAALGLSTAASAASVNNGTTNTLPTKVANVDVKVAADTVTAPLAINLNIDSTDLIIGRTTGFSVRVDLQNGAEFGATPTVAVGGALPNGTSTSWSVSLAAGGQPGDTYAVYSVQPGSDTPGVINGTALTFSGFEVENVAGLATAGTNVAAKFTFADPNTAQQILTPVMQNLLTSANPLKYSIGPSSWQNAKIDVGSQNHDSKTLFAEDGYLNEGDATNTFDAGTINIGVDSGVYDASGAAFSWDGTLDTVDLTVNGTFSAFTQTGASVDLVSGSCVFNSSPTVDATGTVDAAGDKVTFSDSVGTVSGDKLCFTVPSGNTQVIDATSVSTAATVTRNTTGATVSGSGDAMAMAYNGPVAHVYTFNPAANTSMQSFLRITNTGGTSGMVTITGTDDTGTAGGTVSFNLASGKSIQLTAQDLENGNAAKGLTGSLGAGTGKWTLTVTGEISGMEVTNLNRSQSTDMISNLGTPVSGDH